MSIFLGLGLAAKLLGIGLPAGAGIGARILGYDRKALELAKQVPPKGWLIIAAAIALIVGCFVHHHHAQAALTRADQAGYARGVIVYQRALQIVHDRAIARKRAAEAEMAGDTQHIRSRHDEEDRNTAARHDALRLRGPGAASVGRLIDSGVSTATSGPIKAVGPANAAVGRVPYPAWSSLIAMPFDDATDFAQKHDEYRSEVAAWHAWYPKMVADWQKLAARKGKAGR